MWISASVLSIVHLLHSRHAVLRTSCILHVWYIAHVRDPVQELLKVWVILRKIMVHVLKRVSLRIRSLIVLLIIEVLLLVELSIVPTLSMVASVAS